MNNWRSVKTISAFDGYLTSINENGDVVTTDPVTVGELENSQVVSTGAMIPVIKATQEWKHVAAYEGHYPMSAVALFEDGTVRAASSHMVPREVTSVNDWNNIVTRFYIAGVKEVGTVVIAGDNGFRTDRSYLIWSAKPVFPIK